MPPIPPPPDMPPVMEEPEEDTPLICGRNPNLRTNIIKVVDISPDDDMAAISGEILGGSIEEKELKSGKFLISFNVYACVVLPFLYPLNLDVLVFLFLLFLLLHLLEFPFRV